MPVPGCQGTDLSTCARLRPFQLEGELVIASPGRQDDGVVALTERGLPDVQIPAPAELFYEGRNLLDPAAAGRIGRSRKEEGIHKQVAHFLLPGMEGRGGKRNEGALDLAIVLEMSVGVTDVTHDARAGSSPQRYDEDSIRSRLPRPCLRYMRH